MSDRTRRPAGAASDDDICPRCGGIRMMNMGSLVQEMVCQRGCTLAAQPKLNVGGGYARVSIAQWSMDCPEIAALVKAAQDAKTLLFRLASGWETDNIGLIADTAENMSHVLRPFARDKKG